MNPVLRAAAVSKTYGAAPVLRQVDLDVRAGEIHALVGENGAGKSTLIKILTGAVRPDAGAVLLADAPLGADPRAARVRGISCVYQEFTLVPDMSVADNIALGREKGPWLGRGASHTAAAARLRELGATCDPSAIVRTLPVAEQQLVEIARALETDARVLILDEPTASLSAPEVDRLMAVLRRLRARGMGLLYVSHRLEEVFALADRVTVLRDGHVVATAARDALSRDQLIRWMVGREITEEFPARPDTRGEILLDVRSLSSPHRFENVSFSVRAGEILGIGGLVGAGRTSIGLALGGAIPWTGSVSVAGQPVAPATPAAALACGIAYLTEDRKARGIFPHLSVSTNLTLAYLEQFTRGGILQAGLERRAAAEIAARVQVRGVALDQPMWTLSGGTQQKVLLGRFLLDPRKVIVLDEPTRGVDIGARTEIYSLMNRLTASGVAVVMISSDLPELLGMSDRVLIMRDGRMAGELSRNEATPERAMALAAGA